MQSQRVPNREAARTPRRSEQLVTTASFVTFCSLSSRVCAPLHGDNSPPAGDQGFGCAVLNRRRSGSFPDQLLVGPVGAAPVSETKIFRAPSPALLVRAGHGIPQRGRIEQGRKQIEQDGFGNTGSGHAY